MNQSSKLQFGYLGWRWLCLLITVALVATALIPSRVAYAATINVTTTADSIDAAGSCAAVTLASLPGPDGQTSLREAVCAANANVGADIITFSVNGTFALTGAANEDNGGSGDLDVKQSLAIQGNGSANTIIDGSGIERIFDVFPSAASTFGLSAVTVQNGDTRSSSFKEGGAIYLHNNVTTNISNSQIINNFAGANGAIENRGTLTISDSVISNNQTIPASGNVVGGGLHNAGTLTINNTTISNNSVRGEGGGIATTTGSAGVVNITNSTISGNTASVTGGGLGNGGGISTTGNQGTINITNSTISGNVADNNGGGAYFTTPVEGTGNANFKNVTVTNNTANNDNNTGGDGGGVFVNNGTVNVTNTIVANNTDNGGTNTHPDVSGTFTDQGRNLIGKNNGSNFVTGALIGTIATPVNPQLGVLANNGGSTATHSLLSTSPALDAAGTTGLAADQRGVTRPQGTADDIGAVEVAVINGPGGSVTQGTPTTSNNPTPQSCPATGTNLAIYTLNAPLTNSSANSFTDLFFRVKELTYTTAQGGQQPSLCNATTVVNNGGVGSILAIPNSSLPGGNSQFNPSETLTPSFQIGRPVATQFRIKVDLFSNTATAANSNSEGTDGLYLGSFEYLFGETTEESTPAEQIFLPLITR